MDTRRNMSLIAAAARALRSRRARLRFRAAVRSAYANHYWLEDTEGEQLGMNVARNIQILTRKKPKGQFSLLEKSLMRVAQRKRTEPEKYHLRRILGTLKCFRKYPAEVKKELATITYYVEYEAERTIVRQGDEALGLYFVVSGTSRVVMTKIDQSSGKVIHITVKIKEAGDLFGELALLLGAKRSASIITNERSEFLVVKRMDFDRVLKDTVLKEWNEIKKSMAMFEYFKLWDDRYIQQSCMISKMRYYEENNVILSEDCGDKRYVYFVVEGILELIECVQLKVKTFRNKKTYSLFNKLHSASPAERMKSVTVDLGKFVRERLDQMKSTSDVKIGAPVTPRMSALSRSIGSAEFPNFMSKSVLKLQNVESEEFEEPREKTAVRRTSQVVSMPCTKLLEGMDAARRVQYVKKFESSLSRVTCTKEVPVHALETHFIRVAKMNQLATFNIGEHLDSRFYISKTKVKLLAIPHYWLFSRDKPTWNNITIFLKTRLPTRQQLFEEFTKEKRWKLYRKECYYRIADKSKKSNINCINNVPLNIRLKEDLDFHVSTKRLPKLKKSSRSEASGTKVHITEQEILR